jgi:Ca2+-transporting ATPase
LPRGEFIPVEGPPGDPQETGGPERAAEGRTSSEPVSEFDLALALRIGAWRNNSHLVPSGERSKAWQVVGDPTEGALLAAAMKAGIALRDPRQGLIHEHPFDGDRKRMSVVICDEGPAGVRAVAPVGTATMYTKGALEAVPPLCSAERLAGCVVPLSDSRRLEILVWNAALAERALRVLALAYRPGLVVGEPDARRSIAERVHAEPSCAYEESDMILAGLAGLIDPPRKEVTRALALCHRAGIRPVMITGDHPSTALAIARELGLGEPPSSGASRHGGLPGAVLTGPQIDELDDEALAAIVEEVTSTRGSRPSTSCGWYRPGNGAGRWWQRPATASTTLQR